MGKAFIGTHDDFSYAVKINNLSTNDIAKLSFGRICEEYDKINAFKDTGKQTWVGCKGKATLASVKKWIRENKPAEFFAKWRRDSDWWKDDSVEIYYKGELS